MKALLLPIMILAALLPQVSRADNIVDITYKLTNPGFENGITGWSVVKNAGNMNSGGTSANKCYEIWNANGFDFEIYQELKDMPTGVYELEVQGFYRYMGGADAWQHYVAQDVEYVKPDGAPVSLYLNECSEPFINIFADEKQITDASFYSSKCSKFTKDGTTYYFPNNMSDAAVAFSAGLYNKIVSCNVTSGTLRIGIKGTGKEWAIWDNVRLKYHDDNNIFLLDNLTNELTKLIAELQPYLEKLKGKPGYNTLSAALATAQNAINQQDLDAVQAAIDTLKNGKEGWIKEAETDYLGDGTVDITVKLANPDFENGIKGWTVIRGSLNAGGSSNNKCYETWDPRGFDFDIYQELTNMPAGIYELDVQGFYRYMSGDNAWQHYQAQDVEYVRPGGSPVCLYINDESEPFTNVFADGKQITDASFYSSNCSKFTKDGTTYYFPNDMNNAAVAFSAGMYQNTLICTMESGTLRIGIKGAGSEWACWDNVRLIYHGTDTEKYQLEKLTTTLESLIAELQPCLDKLKGTANYNFLSAALAAAQQAIDLQDKNAMQEAIDKLTSGKESWMEAAKMFDELTATLNDLIAELQPCLEKLKDKTGYDSLYAALTAAQDALGQQDINAIQRAIDTLKNGREMWLIAAGDMTCKLVNPDFEDGLTGWTVSFDGGYMRSGGTPNNKCYEIWNGTFEIYQCLVDMPDGIYELEVQGFYRYGEGDNAWQHYLAQDVEYVRPVGSPVLYINDESETFTNIFADEKQVTNALFYSTDCSEFTRNGTIYYYPNSMDDAAVAFAAGMYKKSVLCMVKNGVMRIGIRGTGTWVCWDNIRLLYHGMDEEMMNVLLSKLTAELEELMNELQPYLEKLRGKPDYTVLSAIFANAQHAIDQKDMDAMQETIDKLKSGMDAWKKEAETEYVTIELKAAGTLREEIIDRELVDIHYLALKGPINAEDIIYMRSTAGRLANLEVLDLRGITLVDGEEKYSSYSYGVVQEGGFGGTSWIHEYYISPVERVDTAYSFSYVGNGYSTWTYRHYSSDLGGAFNKMALKKVVLPPFAKDIDDFTFAECPNLETVSQPAGITSVGDRAFYGCKSLISLPDMDGVTTIGQRAFYYCNSLKHVGSLSHVSSLGEEAFYECKALTGGLKLINVDTIPDEAFSYCERLKSVITSNKLRYIGKAAFGGCDSLINVTLPEDLNDIEIGTGAFSGTLWFNSIPAEGGVVYIGPIAMTTRGNPESITFKEGTKKVTDNFVDYGARKVLTSVTIPSSVKHIGDEAFYECSQLASVKLSEGVEEIGYRAFASCAITSLEIPEGIRKMGSNAFSLNGKLLQLTLRSLPPLDADVNNSGGSAFSSCSGLGKVTIGPKVRNIPLECFAYCSDLLRVTFEQRSDADRLYIGHSAFKSCNTLKYIDLPEQTDSIGTDAFYNCSKLTTMVIPANVTSIRNNTFYGCSSLVSVSFPDGLTTIEGGAFENCSSLASVTLPASLTKLELAFYRCYGIKEIVSLIREPEVCRPIGSYHPAHLYVPAGTRLIYERNWEDFFNITEIASCDANFDGVVNVTDIGSVIDCMAGNGDVLTRGLSDVNGDGTTDVADITTIISTMAGKGTGSEEEPELLPDRTPDGVEAIDLGLPSGTKWANMNIGANSPSDAGFYFKWGETTGYPAKDSNSSWANYKWMNEGGTSWEQINKYQTDDGETTACWYDSNGKFIGDNKLWLEPSDDAARANWGGKWTMPALSDIRELIYYTTIDNDGFTSIINGNTVVISTVYKYSNSGYSIWTPTLGDNTSSAYKFYISHDRVSIGGGFKDDYYEVEANASPRTSQAVIRPVMRK